MVDEWTFTRDEDGHGTVVGIQRVRQFAHFQQNRFTLIFQRIRRIVLVVVVLR